MGALSAIIRFFFASGGLLRNLDSVVRHLRHDPDAKTLPNSREPNDSSKINYLAKFYCKMLCKMAHRIEKLIYL